jgi:hypothetical protein
MVRLPDRDIDRAMEVARTRMPPSPAIREIRIEDYVDSVGEDALQVRVILAEDAERTWRDLKPLHEAIRDSLLDAGEERFAFIRFYSPAEFAEELEAQEEGH